MAHVKRRPTGASILLAGAVFCAIVVADNNLDVVRPDGRRSNDGYYRDEARRYITVPCVPKPIQPSDLDRWALTLRLSEAQIQALKHSAYFQYVQNEQVIHDKFVQPLWDQTADIQDQGPLQANLAGAEEFAHMVKTSRERAVQQLVDVENQFFALMCGFLTEEQLQSLPRVRNQRARQRCHGASSYPAGDADVTIMLDEMLLAGMDLEPKDPAAFQAILVQFDAQVTPWFERRAQAIVNGTSDGTVTQIRQLGGHINHVEAQEKVRELRQKVLECETRIHELNRKALTDLAAQIPAPTALELQRGFNLIHFPAVYPDPTDLGGLFDAVAALSDLNTDQREAISLIQGDFATKHREVCEAMIDRFCKWRINRMMGTRGNDVKSYEDDMKILYQNRSRVARETLFQIVQVLSEQQRAVVQTAFESVEAAMKTHRQILDPRIGR